MNNNNFIKNLILFLFKKILKLKYNWFWYVNIVFLVYNKVIQNIYILNIYDIYTYTYILYIYEYVYTHMYSVYIHTHTYMIFFSNIV